ncbi:MAG: hypothetical protein R6U19_01010, partial [Bacteroidales bacterium]
AYNMGSSRTGRVLEDQQEDNYHDLYLNPETARHVYRILAVKTIYESPREYGFYFRKKDFYPPLETKTVETDSTEIDLVDFAKSHGVSYKILKMLNPWLRSDKLTNNLEKRYEFKLPKENGLHYSHILRPYEDNQILFNDTLSVQQIR